MSIFLNKSQTSIFHQPSSRHHGVTVTDASGDVGTILSALGGALARTLRSLCQRTASAAIRTACALLYLCLPVPRRGRRRLNEWVEVGRWRGHSAVRARARRVPVSRSISSKASARHSYCCCSFSPLSLYHSLGGPGVIRVSETSVCCPL